MFREHSVAMILRDLALDPMTATLVEWRIGAAIAVEALLYGLPLLVLFPLVEHLGALPVSGDPKLETWRWTGIQAATAALLVIGMVSLRCPVGSDFIYFQF